MHVYNRDHKMCHLFLVKERAEENVYVTHNVGGNQILFG